MPLSEILEKINPQGKSLSDKGELYLGLVIGEKVVKSGIWNFIDGEGTVLSFGSPENWEGQNAEELIVVADASIASAVSKLPEVSGRQPTKTILGLPESWVEGSSIEKGKLKMVEEACKKLLLKPLGFVVTPESIAHLLKKEEGGSPSVILVSLENSEMIISLLCGGKFLGSKVVGRSDNLALDLEEGLLRFDYKENLPSRILLLDGENLEEAKQALVSYPWVGPEKEKKLSFLQLPRVEIAPPETEVSAVILAGSRDLGGTIKEKEVPEPLPPAVFSKEDFGFIEGKDIAGQEPRAKEPEPVIEEEMGKPQKEKPRRRFSFEGAKKIPGFFGSFRFALPRGKIWLLFGAVSLLLAVALFAVVSVIKVEVKLLVRPQKIVKEFDFTVSAKVSSPDQEKMVLPLREAAIEVSGQKTAAVVGKKTVGEKAIGEVTIYNRTDQTKLIPKNTALKGPAGLKFVLSEEVKVASKTADLEKGVDKWGEQKAKVVAGEIGTQYNLAANSAFTVEGVSTSSILIKNTEAFSGGTSREIQAVTKEDRENLQKALTEELKKQAQDSLGEKIDPKDLVLPDLAGLDNKTDSFNREAGDEAQDLTLEEKAVFVFPYLKNEDFLSLAQAQVSSEIADGFEREPFKKEESFKIKDEKKALYSANVSLEFLPEIKTGEILAKLPFKTFSQAESYLKSLAQIAGVNISVRPTIFSWFKVFPPRKDNIKIMVEPL